MSNPKHTTALVPRDVASIDINYLLDHYAERIAARSGPRPGVPLVSELQPPASPAHPLTSSGAIAGSPADPKSPLAQRLASAQQKQNLYENFNMKFIDGETPKHIPPGNDAQSEKNDEDKAHGEGGPTANQFREEVASFLLKAPYTVSIFGAGFQGGQPIGGVETAPNALRAGGLADSLYKLGWEVVDRGNAELHSELNAENDPPVAGVNAPIRVSSGCYQTYKAAAEAAAKGQLALTLGGDHSAAIGSIAGVASKYPNVGVVWVDAHADLNTPMISPSGNLHGMPVGFLLGLVEGKIPGLEWFKPCLAPDRIVYVGLRDVDFVEKKLLRRLGIKAFSMHEVDKFGIGKVMKMALDHLSPLRHRPIHLSFDVDSIDPTICPSTGTPVMGGLTFREAAYVCEAVAETGLLVGLDIVEVNPALGTATERDQTVEVALGLIRSAVGHQLV